MTNVPESLADPHRVAGSTKYQRVDAVVNILLYESFSNKVIVLEALLHHLVFIEPVLHANLICKKEDKI